MFMAIAPAPLRLRLDEAALISNYRRLEKMADVPVIPAVKANGYGLGAAEIVRRLEDVGARCFAVATWSEAIALQRTDVQLLVLHGYTADCGDAARNLPLARPVLNTARQCAEWLADFPGRIADLMVDTGMNRLGIGAGELPIASDIPLDTIHSHFACADIPDHPLTGLQLVRFGSLAALTPTRRHAIANSAGISLGRKAAFSAVRPGLALYGGEAFPGSQGQAVVRPEARIIQLRNVAEGECVGYGAAWRAERPSEIAILNIGYADGVFRSLGSSLFARHREVRLPLAGRISMDMIAIDVTGLGLSEGDWLELEWNIPELAHATGFSQYELLVGLGSRFERLWA